MLPLSVWLPADLGVRGLTTSTRRWPTAVDYAEAVQNPSVAFRVQPLRAAKFDTNMLGLPNGAEGQNAIVFPASIGDVRKGIRCYKHLTAAGRKRQELLAQHLPTGRLPALVSQAFHPDAMYVRNDWWPISVLQWVDGSNLADYVEDNLQDGARLRWLAAQWRSISLQMSSIRLAHGDLQHDNIRVSRDGAIHLIDYDAVWLPELARLPPENEVGQRHYQHPSRLKNADWDENVDSFSGLVLYLSLTALAADPALWTGSGDYLILSHEDYQSPGGTPAWAALSRSTNEEVRRGARLLAELCRAPHPPRVGWQQLLSEAAQVQAGPDVLVDPYPDPALGQWWDDTAGAGGTVKVPKPETALPWWISDQPDAEPVAGVDDEEAETEGLGNGSRIIPVQNWWDHGNPQIRQPFVRPVLPLLLLLLSFLAVLAIAATANAAQDGARVGTASSWFQ